MRHSSGFAAFDFGRFDPKGPSAQIVKFLVSTTSLGLVLGQNTLVRGHVDLLGGAIEVDSGV